MKTNQSEQHTAQHLTQNQLGNTLSSIQQPICNTDTATQNRHDNVTQQERFQYSEFASVTPSDPAKLQPEIMTQHAKRAIVQDSQVIVGEPVKALATSDLETNNQVLAVERSIKQGQTGIQIQSQSSLPPHLVPTNMSSMAVTNGVGPGLKFTTGQIQGLAQPQPEFAWTNVANTLNFKTGSEQGHQNTKQNDSLIAANTMQKQEHPKNIKQELDSKINVVTQQNGEEELSRVVNQQQTNGILHQGPQGAQLVERQASVVDQNQQQNLLMSLRQGMDLNDLFNNKQFKRDLVSRNTGHLPTQQNTSKIVSMQSIDKNVIFKQAEQPLEDVQPHHLSQVPQQLEELQQHQKDTQVSQQMSQAVNRLSRNDEHENHLKNVRVNQNILAALRYQRQHQNQQVAQASQAKDMGSQMASQQSQQIQALLQSAQKSKQQSNLMVGNNSRQNSQFENNLHGLIRSLGNRLQQQDQSPNKVTVPTQNPVQDPYKPSAILTNNCQQGQPFASTMCMDSYLGKVGISSSGQDSSSNENQASYNQAQVKQGEPSDVKNTTSGGQYAQMLSNNLPVGQGEKLSQQAQQIDQNQQIPNQNNQLMNNIMDLCLNNNTITNKDLFESLKKFTHQSATEVNIGNNSKSHFTLPTKATGEDQSMMTEGYAATHMNQGTEQMEKNEAQLKKEAHSNLAQQKQQAKNNQRPVSQGAMKSDGFKQINDIVQRQYMLLLNKQPQGHKQSVSSSEIYMSCAQLQQWLQENWLIGSLIIKMIVQKQMDEFSNFKGNAQAEQPQQHNLIGPPIFLQQNNQGDASLSRQDGGNDERQQLDQFLNPRSLLQDLKDKYQSSMQQFQATNGQQLRPEGQSTTPNILSSTENLHQILRSQFQNQEMEKQPNQILHQSKQIMQSIQQNQQQVSQDGPNELITQFDQSKTNVGKQLGLLLGQRNKSEAFKRQNVTGNEQMVGTQSLFTPNQQQILADDQRLGGQQQSNIMPETDKSKMVQMLQTILKNKAIMKKGNSDNIQNLQMYLQQQQQNAVTQQVQDLEFQQPKTNSQGMDYIQQAARVQHITQQFEGSQEAKQLERLNSQQNLNGVGMKRSFEQMQQKARSNVQDQQQIANTAVGMDGSLKLLNHESFDKLSQRRLNQQFSQTRANLIDRICEKQAHHDQDEPDGSEEMAAVVQRDNGRMIAAALGDIIESQRGNNGQQEEMQDLSLQNLQKMVTDLNDDSTPSREKDHSSKAINDLYESSGLVKRETAQQDFQYKNGQPNFNNINEIGQINEDPRKNLTGQRTIQSSNGPLIASSSRRSNKHLSYEEQILKSLRLVIREEDLIKIRDNIMEGIKKYQRDLNKVIIEAQLPRKNHGPTKDDFRGSKYRGPSKNRKKWQVMKMINKETVRIGAVRSELDAARIYDFLAILTEGLIAKTNFNYNVEQIQIIMREFYFKDENSIGAHPAQKN